jgi:DNA relaxase NicK
MTEITYRPHWLAFTVHAPNNEFQVIYDTLFYDLFGPVQSIKHGGRGFQLIYKNGLEFKIYCFPLQEDKQYFSYKIPGAACDCIPWEYYRALYDLLESNNKDSYQFTRFDLAFDNVPFEPQQVRDAIVEEKLRSLAKRETLQIHESPLAKKDNGDLGTCTVELGSRTSERMIRVYNKRGFTRIEFEMKEERADLVAKEILALENESHWYKVGIAHLLDYVDFKTDWWEKFIRANKRAGVTLSKPEVVSLNKLVNWMDKQVFPSLSVMYDVFPIDTIHHFIDRGKKKRGDRYDLILANYHKRRRIYGVDPGMGKKAIKDIEANLLKDPKNE